MKSKTWKEYFLEFFMLFLAVSLGFLADNFREKKSDRTKEREYIQSMIEDVKEDRANIKEVMSRNSARSKQLDSLIVVCFNYQSSDSNALKLYKHFPHVLFHPEFIAPIESTMQQLKNAGGMRLIKSKKAINEIIRYDSKVKKIANQQLYYENYQNKAIDTGTKVLNLQKLVTTFLTKENGLYQIEEFELLNEDSLKLKELGNNIVMYKGIIDYYLALLREINEQGMFLTQTLKSEYELR